jgi:hypothetical protein
VHETHKRRNRTKAKRERSGWPRVTASCSRPRGGRAGGCGIASNGDRALLAIPNPALGSSARRGGREQHRFLWFRSFSSPFVLRSLRL